MKIENIFCKSSEKMSEIKDSSVNLIVTSPPYFSLKDYGSKKQIGLNQTYKEYTDSLNKVWKECIRVLAPDGKLCINIMPLFDKGVKGKNKRRITKLAIDDIIKFAEDTGDMFLLSLYIETFFQYSDKCMLLIFLNLNRQIAYHPNFEVE